MQTFIYRLSAFKSMCINIIHEIRADDKFNECICYSISILSAERRKKKNKTKYLPYITWKMWPDVDRLQIGLQIHLNICLHMYTRHDGSIDEWKMFERNNNQICQIIMTRWFMCWFYRILVTHFFSITLHMKQWPKICIQCAQQNAKTTNLLL